MVVCLRAGEGIANEDNGPDALFSLAAVKGAAAAQTLGEAAAPDDAEAAVAASASEDADESGASSGSEDSDDARRSVNPRSRPLYCAILYHELVPFESISCNT